MIDAEEKGIVELQWRAIQGNLKGRFSKVPDLDAILFLIGLQELRMIPEKLKKEQKQDLMHVAVCKLLSYDGLYELEGTDNEGWPHYRKSTNFPKLTLDEQEYLLKRNIVRYFDEGEPEVLNIVTDAGNS